VDAQARRGKQCRGDLAFHHNLALGVIQCAGEGLADGGFIKLPENQRLDQDEQRKQ
jgi:hypothetical protein